MGPCLEAKAEVEVKDCQELEIKHFNRGMKIWNITQLLHSSNASLMNMQPKRRWLIPKCTWCLQCNNGTRLWRNYRRSFMPRCQEMGKSARTNGVDWILITKNSWIITKELGITHLYWNWPWRSTTSLNTSIHVWDLQAKGDANYIAIPILDS